jgi:hypothetical protein
MINARPLHPHAVWTGFTCDVNGENTMNRPSILTLSTEPMQRWDFLLLVTSAAAGATPASAQEVAPLVELPPSFTKP